jgi:RNA-directed DNA polymerase
VQTAKPCMISKRMVWDASQRVKANQGAAGVAGEALADFEGTLAQNLSKRWNRLASGSAFPPPGRTVAIPKRGGGQRMVGMPTGADRVAQTVVAMALEPGLAPHVHPDS